MMYYPETGLTAFVSDNTATLTPSFNGYGEVTSLETDIAGTTSSWSVSRNDAAQIICKTEIVAGFRRPTPTPATPRAGSIR